MSGTGYPNGAPAGGRSPRRSTPRRIGWRAAGRILDGRHGGRGTDDLHALIAMASAPASPPTGHAGTGRAEAVPPNAVLAAFHETAAASPTTARKPVRRGSSSRGLALRFAASILVVCGAGVAAASAGVLPSGMQRIAHDYLGVGSAPASSAQVPSSSAATSGTPTSGAATTPITTGAVPTSAVAALCRQISPTGSDWRANLSTADQATLISAAGGDHKVKQYCARVLEDFQESPKATPSPETIGTPSSIPSAKPTQTHGDPHASRSPMPHSTSR